MSIPRVSIVSWVLVALWLSASSSDAVPVEIINNGPSSNRVDIVFMGDGYTAGDLAAGTYTTHINAMVSHLFSAGVDPFPRYQKFFNAYRIDVVSNQSGADVPPLGIYRDTALDASYYWDGYTERLLYINTTKANARLSSELAGAGFSAEMRLVTVNDTRYGGGGGYYAVYAGGNSSAPEVATHEMAHSFAGLADEYDYGTGTYTGSEPSEPNVTKDSGGSKWSAWLGYTDPNYPAMGPIGAYEGARYYRYGLYRPSLSSKMRALGQPFDAVGREALILSMYDCVDPLDGWLANGAVLTDPISLWVDVLDPNVISVQWYADGILVPSAGGETFSLALAGLAPGQHLVTAHAYDTTIGDWVRRSTSQLQQDVTWTVIVTASGDVPEPASLTLLAGSLLALIRRRRGSASVERAKN